MQHVIAASPPLGFNRGRPVAACLAYKAIVHWSMIEVGRGNAQERVMEHVMEVAKGGDINTRCYWISNAMHLHFLVRESREACMMIIGQILGQEKFPKSVCFE